MGKIEDLEDKLLVTLRQMGLSRTITYHHFDKPKELTFKRKRLVINETVVGLHFTEELEAHRKEWIKSNGEIPPLVPQAIGTSYCSVRDKFNKKLGRMIATARALDQFLIKTNM